MSAWTVPRLYAGCIVYCLGSGPSLTSAGGTGNPVSGCMVDVNGVEDAAAGQALFIGMDSIVPAFANVR